MNDLAGWKLRGPVETLRTQHAEWDRDRAAWQAPRSATTVTFRPDGQVSAGECRNPDGSVTRWVRFYDPQGRVTEAQHWRDEGPRERVLHGYDDRGRLIAVERLSADGTRRVIERARYDAAGRQTKVIDLPRENANAGVHYMFEGTDPSYSTAGAATITVDCDASGLASEARFHDVGGVLLRHIVFARDAAGRLLTAVVSFGAETPFPEAVGAAGNLPPAERASCAAALEVAFAGAIFCKTTYAYDTAGRLVERITTIGTLSEDRTTYRYDAHDDPMAESFSSRTRRLGVDDRGGVSGAEDDPPGEQHIRYDYEFDSRGNWTERVASSRIGGQPGFDRASIERRTITYYNPDRDG